MDNRKIALVLVVILIASAAGLALAMGPVCGNGLKEGKLPDPRYEECDDGNSFDGDGCSATCMVEFPEKIYVAQYLGNIDGGFAEEWFYFYGQIGDFIDQEEIKVGATIYPDSINKSEEFALYAKKYYESPNIELVQKANTGVGIETQMDRLEFMEQVEVISKGRDNFKMHMAKILEIPEEDVIVPRAYNQPQGRFTDVSRMVLEFLDFKIFFEMYMNDDLGPIESTKNLDVIQYGLGFDKEGRTGRETEFHDPGDFLVMLREFDRTDLYMLDIYGTKVVPVWVHHMDFERKDKPNSVDREKWAIYTYLMKRIKQEPNLEMVLPSEIWEMRH